jgi:hypothetical protein
MQSLVVTEGEGAAFGESSCELALLLEMGMRPNSFRNSSTDLPQDARAM